MNYINHIRTNEDLNQFMLKSKLVISILLIHFLVFVTICNAACYLQGKYNKVEIPCTESYDTLTTIVANAFDNYDGGVSVIRDNVKYIHFDVSANETSLLSALNLSNFCSHSITWDKNPDPDIYGYVISTNNIDIKIIKSTQAKIRTPVNFKKTLYIQAVDLAKQRSEKVKIPIDFTICNR